ncbi:uncharacterized protein A4U43_C06F10530 [Asparagus officinalis]|uniref:Fiber protein Fb34 n=2 Tax=Asparagus officinalis TaxID=4686 RepID=A0A5P1EKX3_ASPOF|nr:uncharacterized protein A4U43_C06F10530 [Asparagus officinalis]
MAVSLPVVASVCFLQVMAFVLAIGAEKRRSTGKVRADEYDERTYCVYDTDASTVYGLSAFALVMLSQALVNAITRCLCCRRGISGGGPGACAITAFVLSWLSFFLAEALLIAGSVRNAYHTKYVGYYIKKDLTSCAALRKGVFAAAAAMILISWVSLLSYYWSYSKSDTGGWVRHQNDTGIGMAEYGHDNPEIGKSQVR